MNPERFFEQQQEQTDIPARLKFVEQIRNAMPGGEFSFRITQGELRGLANEVKPAVLMTDDGQVVAELLSRVDPSLQERLFVQGKYLVDRQLLAQRVKNEGDFAQELGWDGQRSLEENLHALSVDKSATPQAHALAGFVLGYPASTVRRFFERAQLLKNHVPDFDVLIESVVDPVTLGSFRLDQWSKHSVALWKEMQPAVQGMKNRLSRLPENDPARGALRTELLGKILEKYKDNLREICYDCSN